MSAKEEQIRPITLVKRSSPVSEVAAHSKAEFDRDMVMIRHRVEYADKDAALYFYRELMRETQKLAKRFGLKTIA